MLKPRLLLASRVLVAAAVLVSVSLAAQWGREAWGPLPQPDFAPLIDTSGIPPADLITGKAKEEIERRLATVPPAELEAHVDAQQKWLEHQEQQRTADMKLRALAAFWALTIVGTTLVVFGPRWVGRLRLQYAYERNTWAAMREVDA